MEVWDAYYSDGSLAGRDLIRGEPIPDGLYHIVCEILVKHVDGSYLLMQRDFEKEGYPGMFETSAGGSALKGEDAVAAAIRELREETGIAAQELLQLVGPAIGGKGLFYCFLCETDCDKKAVTLQEGETVAYKWLSKDEFIAFMDSGDCIPPQKKRWAQYVEGIRNER